MACSTESSRNLSIGITAAGFPVNWRVAKASTWNICMRMGNGLLEPVG
jgi:hypothetical protein